MRFAPRPELGHETRPLDWGLVSRWDRYPDLRAYRETGNRAALERVMRDNTALAMGFAREFCRSRRAYRIRREDAEAAALEGMWVAIRRFDPAKGSFSQAVYWSVREALSKLLAYEVRGVMVKGRLAQAAGWVPDEYRGAPVTPAVGDESSHLRAVNSEASDWSAEDEAEARGNLERALRASRATDAEKGLVALLVSGMSEADAVSLSEIPEAEAAKFLRKLRRVWGR